MGAGDGWRDAGDRRPHARALLVLLGALLVVAQPPACRGRAARRLPRLPLAPAADASDGHGRPARRRDADLRPRAPGTTRPRRPTTTRSNGCAATSSTIEDATAADYVVEPEDAGLPLVCSVRVVNGQADRYESSDGLFAREPESRSAPRLSGDPRIGGELRCSRGVWDDRGLPPYATTFVVDARRRADRGRQPATVTRSPPPTSTTALACSVTAAEVAHRLQRRDLPAAAARTASCRSSAAICASAASRRARAASGTTRAARAYARRLPLAARRRADPARRRLGLHGRPRRRRRRADVPRSPPRA